MPLIKLKPTYSTVGTILGFRPVDTAVDAITVRIVLSVSMAGPDFGGSARSYWPIRSTLKIKNGE